jgi:hypothetical protein
MTKIQKFFQFNESALGSTFWNLIPESIKTIHAVFQASGYKLFLVGGAVRDFIQDDIPKDYDLATDAHPKEVMSLLDGYELNLQGKAFGVVVVYTEDQPLGMEIATFRKDVSKGRNPLVELIGVTIEDDVRRRDITYNALFFDLDKKEIVDLVGGVEDLKNKITRMVGDAIERLDEDSLRILRAFRFAARYNSELDADLVSALRRRNWLKNINHETGKLERISQERIWQDEIVKAWKQAKNNYTKYLKFFTEFDMWPEVFPGAVINSDIVKCEHFEVYMANLFRNMDVDVAHPQKSEAVLVANYKIDGNTAAVIVFLVSLLQLTPQNALRLYRTKTRCVSMGFEDIDPMIIDWFNVNSITDSTHSKFISYRPTVDVEFLKSQGFKDKALGDEIQRLEVIEFTKLIK